MTPTRYPTISRSDCDRLAAAQLAGQPVSVESVVVWAGTGDEVGLAAFHDFNTRLKAELSEFQQSKNASDKDAFEGKASGALHASLSAVPIPILDDPSFWRYIALEMWWFIEWREKLTEHNVAGYVDATRSTECVPLRMFLRAQAIVRDGDYELAGSIVKGTDFWRSHVIRVKVGTVGPVARTFAQLQATEHMTTGVLRPFARRLNRVSTNVVLHVLDDDDAAELIEDLKSTD